MKSKPCKCYYSGAKLCYNPSMAETDKIRILIADDFKSLRDVIRLYLAQAEDMNVIDEAPDLSRALEQTKALQPDVIIMNDYLPPIDSAHATALFRDQGITAAVLVISLQVEARLVDHALRSGVNGFISKDEINPLLVEAVRRVHRGERYLSPDVQETCGTA